MKRLVIVLLAVFVTLPLLAQDFGFGFDDDDMGNTFGGSHFSGSSLAVSVGGEIAFHAIGFFDDFSNGTSNTQFGDLLSGKLNFTADSSRAKGVINLNLKPTSSPVTIDEAYLLAYLGKLDLSAGLRKLSWGKADRLGPLDVINPLDYSDLGNLSDIASLKIARPLIHASLYLGQFSKLEGVFVFNFEPVRSAESGRWASPQFATLNQLPPENILIPNTTTIDYAQAGIRFTTTIGGTADIGVQYYYGRLKSPAVTQTLSSTPPLPIVSFAYNPYHQIGIDYAQVLAGFNIRAEAAANITEDINGDDMAIQNPSLAWSLGFDRDLFWDITLTVQCNETIRLLNGKITDENDIEHGTDVTSTTLTFGATRTFLRNELEVKAAAIWDIESGVCVLMPSIIWSKDDFAVELATGIFTGSDKGLYGAFHDNSFVKMGLKYTF